MTLSKQSLHICLCSVILSIAVSSYAQVTLTPGHEERDVGISLYKQGNIKSAIKALQNAVRKNKLDVDAWYFLGLACNAAVDAKCAQKAFQETIKLRPTFAEARTGLAYNLFRLKKLKEAVKEAEIALRLKPGQEAAHFVIGAVRFRQSSNLEAAERANEALMARPNYPPALLLKSQALFALYFDEISFNRPVATSKESAEEIGNKRRGYLIEAAAALEKYIELQPSEPDINVWREQLETLRVHATETPFDKEVFSGREVTTKAIVKNKPPPHYTVMARVNGVTGVVVLRAIFAADGTVRNIRAISGLPDGLTQAAIAAARKIKFSPATKNGRPVSMYIQLEYHFNAY